VQEMKVWPFGVALRGVMPNRPELRWLKTVVVSVGEKAQVYASGGDREGERERTADDVSKQAADIRTGSVKWVRDEPGGGPVYWPGGVRHGGGASPVCGFCMERGKADADTAAVAPEGTGGKRERAVRRKPEALSTVAASAGGPARSSGEALVTGVERRGRLICRSVRASNRGLPWEEAGGHVGTAGQAV
jgi:hypothetical protein